MSPPFSSKSPTIRRILREAAELSTSPSADYTAEPLEDDLFEWHFTLRGPPNSVYADGVYHGRIVLPPAYPLRPPAFRFTTPNGRFEANREICLSISGHHEETWQPAWGIRTAVVALRSFMETDARGQLGGLETTEPVRRRLATESASFKCATCGRTNADIIKDCEDRAKEVPEGQDIEVPQELNMGWRDEMADKKAAALPVAEDQSRPGTGEEPGAQEASDTDELAEGFVPTVESPSPGQRAPEPYSSLSPHGAAEHLRRQATPLTRPAQVAPQAPTRRPQPPVAELQRARDDGVPLWIDRAIVALVIVLSALVLKIFFGV